MNVIQDLPISIFVIGLDHKVLHWNRALEKLTNITAEEVIGTTYHRRIFSGGERPCLSDLLVDQAQDKISKWYSDKWTRSASIEGAYEATEFFSNMGEGGKWLRFTAAVIKDSQGNPAGAVEIIEDISERKLTEQALIDSELRLQSIIQGSPIPTFVIGKDHRIIHWNRALEELTGIRAEEVVGTTDSHRPFYSERRPSLADLMVEQALDAIPQWYFEKFIKSNLLNEAYEATDFFPDLKGGGKWLRFTAAVIRDSEGSLVGAMETLEDVSERKKAEEQLIMITKLESLVNFADGIAHDFNNVISIMLRNMFAAQMSLIDEPDGLWRERLELAEKAGFQAKELVHRLISFAKGEEPIKKVGSISQLLMESVDLPLSGSKVRCEFHLPGDLWMVLMDEVQIRQVICNLVINAREAVPDGGVITISAKNVNVTADYGLPLKEGKYVKWSVEDHGVGIAREHTQKVFDPYFTTKSMGAARGKGLGLSISYSIVKRHDGYIGFKSEPNVGSEFYVYLPASLQANHMVDSCQTEEEQGRILVMDDEEPVRIATGIVLHYLGYEVEYARDGREAVDLYKTAREKGKPFCAAMLDLNVSGDMRCSEAVKELLDADPRARIILSSWYSDYSTVAEFSERDLTRIVDLPYDIDAVKNVLEELARQAAGAVKN